MKYNDKNISFTMRLDMIEYYATCVCLYTHITISAICIYLYAHMLSFLHTLRGGNLLDLSGVENISKVKIIYGNYKYKA